MNIRLHYFEGKRSDTSHNNGRCSLLDIDARNRTAGARIHSEFTARTKAVAMKQWMLFIVAIASLSMVTLRS
jgi:hypothetical protein